jgi:hypothetical protein
MSGFLSRPALRLNRRPGLRLPVTENREIRAVHAAKIAARAFISVNQVWRVVALGVERRGELQDMGGAELHAEPASFTAFGDNNDGASIQGAPLLPYSIVYAIRVPHSMV